MKVDETSVRQAFLSFCLLLCIYFLTRCITHLLRMWHERPSQMSKESGKLVWYQPEAPGRGSVPSQPGETGSHIRSCLVSSFIPINKIIIHLKSYNVSHPQKSMRKSDGSNSEDIGIYQDFNKSPGADSSGRKLSLHTVHSGIQSLWLMFTRYLEYFMFP